MMYPKIRMIKLVRERAVTNMSLKGAKELVDDLLQLIVEEESTPLQRQVSQLQQRVVLLEDLVVKLDRRLSHVEQTLTTLIECLNSLPTQ